VAITDREEGAVPEQREQLVEEIRTAERARDLLAGLERRLKERDRSELEEHLGRLERLAGSLPEAHPVRLSVESAVGSARARGAGYAGSAASRARSMTEGRLSTLRGSQPPGGVRKHGRVVTRHRTEARSPSSLGPSLIQRSAWNKNSANFALTEF
jgi:hypothetical protein